MPPGFTFSINPIYLSKYGRSNNFAKTIQARYPGENSADAALQLIYWQNIHGFVSGTNE